ncbi:MAG: hypothetical protein KF823_02390 [Xanthomonadales bacterium]|nr:hypothetical protein [Xanthomonadales bacterium]
MNLSHLFEQAAAAYRQGDDAHTLALSRRLLDADPGQPRYLMLAANAALRSGQWPAAIEALQALLNQQPGQAALLRPLAQAWNRQGLALRRAGQAAAAEVAFRAALGRQRGQPEATFNLALLLDDEDRPGAALPLWRELATANPEDIEVRTRLARCLALCDDHRQAASLLDTLPAAGTPALALDQAEAQAACGRLQQAARTVATLPDDPALLSRLATVADTLAQAGAIEAGAGLHQACHRLLDAGASSPGLRHLFARHLLLPAVPADTGAIDQARQRFAQGLDALAAELTPARLAGCARTLDQLAWSNFYLAYQGRDDLELQTRFGDLLGRCARALAPAGLPDPSGSGGRRRIALVGSIFRHCTAGHYFASWVRILADAGFEVHVVQLGPAGDAFTDTIAAPATALHRIEGGADALARHLAGLRCDLILYPELGMEARLPALASLRLAPRQACAWGHPVSSGLATIDAFFSCADMEPEGAQGHYREPLRLLPGLGTHYPAPPQPAGGDRASAGLPTEGRLYLIPHAPYKLHPDNDAVLAAIATGDPQARLVLFRGQGAGSGPALLRRLGAALEQAGADPDRQLCVLDNTSREGFLAVNRVCDVMVDCLHWSGGNTSLDALSSGLPVLTCPGPYMRGRQSAAMLRQLGLERLVFDAPDDLVRTAIDLAGDRHERESCARQIRAGLPDLLACPDLPDRLVAHVEALLDN